MLEWGFFDEGKPLQILAYTKNGQPDPSKIWAGQCLY